MLLLSVFYFVSSLLIFLILNSKQKQGGLFLLEYSIIVFLCYLAILYMIYMKQTQKKEKEDFLSYDTRLKHVLQSKYDEKNDKSNNIKHDEADLFVKRLKENIANKEAQQHAEKLLSTELSDSTINNDKETFYQMNDTDLEKSTTEDNRTTEENRTEENRTKEAWIPDEYKFDVVTCEEEMIPEEESCNICKIKKRIKKTKNVFKKKDRLDCEKSTEYNLACKDNWQGYIKSDVLHNSLDKFNDVTGRLNEKILPKLRNLSTTFGVVPENNDGGDTDETNDDDEPTFLNPYYVQENKDTYIKLGILNENAKVDENNDNMDLDNIDLNKLNEMNVTVDRINYVLNNLQLYAPDFYQNILNKYR